MTLQVTADAAGDTCGSWPPLCGGAAQGAKWPAPQATKADPVGADRQANGSWPSGSASMTPTVNLIASASRTTLPLPAQAGEKGLTVRLGDTAVSGSRRGYAMDLRVAFILEKLA